MYIVGEEEVEAVARVIRTDTLFRYGIGQECSRFEERYASYLETSHVALAASGTNALAAAIVGVGLGPGDEVLIPAHTYMATATSVLVAGAIPVFVNIDESLTIDPDELERMIGPRTRAVIPVHMWGTTCDMDRIMAIAEKHKLHVIEDACQGVGGGYRGRKLGTIGTVGCYSFNYYKNMTAGEGGAVATRNDHIAERVRCAIDPCNFYWQGRSESVKPFAGNGARATEFMGAMLNVQLDRIDGMIAVMRKERDAILEVVGHLSNLGLKAAPLHSASDDCATHAILTFPTADQAATFTRVFPSVIAGKTGRHTYTEWDQVLTGDGAAHPEMNPFRMAANRECRKTYSRDMCKESLEILARTVLVPTHPRHSDADIAETCENIRAAGRVAMGDLSLEEARFTKAEPIEARRFDLKKDA